MCKALLVISLTICSLPSFGQSYFTNPSEQDYYDFFNSFINTDSIRPFNLASEPEFEEIIKDTVRIFQDSLFILRRGMESPIKVAGFTSNDINYIRQQLIVGKMFKWTDGKILGSKIIDRRELHKYFKRSNRNGWKIYYKKHKSGFASYSTPLFSVDRTKCVVFKGWHCGGLCGQGSVYLFVKRNNKWEVETIYSTYMN